MGIMGTAVDYVTVKLYLLCLLIVDYTYARMTGEYATIIGVNSGIDAGSPNGIGNVPTGSRLGAKSAG